MRRAKTISRNSVGAIGTRSLPLSFLGLALIVTSVAFANPNPAHMPADWRGYALSRITPEFSWAEQALPAEPPKVLDRVGSDPVSDFALTLVQGEGFDIGLEIHARKLHGRPAGALGGELKPRLIDSVGSPFSGSAANTGISGHFGAAELGVAVVLVHQRYAAPALAGIEFVAGTPRAGIETLAETSQGAGVELRAAYPLSPSLDWNAGYRSRIGMDRFQFYRGIYGKPGDMDIPASAHLGLAWQMDPKTSLELAVDRVMYSEVEPFVSAALPRPVLALLGDATSPEFTWRDLDIYSLALRHDTQSAGSFTVRYSTREQPVPTSELLAGVLLDSAADYGVAFSWQRQVGLGVWRVVANYAPAEYVLGAPTSLYGNAPGDGRQVEFEALWSMPF